MATLFRRILVPHDFSPAADAALRVAAGLAREAGGRLTVLHAIAPFFAVPEVPLPATFIPTPELVADARRRLESATRRVLGSEAPPMQFRVEVAEPLDAILDAAARADCVVLSTTGRSGLSHLLIGSVAEKVVRHSPIPVLTIRSKPPRPARGVPARASRRARAR